MREVGISGEVEEDETGRGVRRSIYLLLIVVALGALAGKIGRVESRDQRTPFLSANDRSRWCTIRSLVHDGCYEIDIPMRDRRWQTIDRVRHLGRDGKLHYYSSKPPLFPTLLAGQYWVIRQITGASIIRDPLFVGRWMLALTNVTLAAVYLFVMAKLAERWGESTWGKLFVVITACFGTFVTTFAVTLNNHLPATTCTAIAFYLALQIWYDEQRSGWAFACTGLTAAFAAANELPALSFFAAVTVALGICSWTKTLLWYLPAAALVGAGFFGTNYLAHGSLIPAYGHEAWYAYEGSPWLPENRRGIDRGEENLGLYVLHSTVGHHGVISLTPVWLLSIVGLGMWATQRRRPAMLLLVGSLTLVCFAFYMFLARDRNYGGVTSGFRWMFWFAPMWLYAMIPAVDRCAASRLLRGVATILLLVSVASAAYAAMNPWVHPWIYAMSH